MQRDKIVAASLRRTAKLLRVMVMGGAVLSGACGSVPKDKPAEGSSSKADGKGSQKPPPAAGGVSSW
jgi:hypothetical protein